MKSLSPLLYCSHKCVLERSFMGTCIHFGKHEINVFYVPYWAFLVAQIVKNLPTMQETWVWSLVRRIPWRWEWRPTPVFFPGESHGQRSLVGYSPWGRKELDMTDWLTLSLSSPILNGFNLTKSSVLHKFMLFPLVTYNINFVINVWLLEQPMRSFELGNINHINPQSRGVSKR